MKWTPGSPLNKYTKSIFSVSKRDVWKIRIGDIDHKSERDNTYAKNLDIMKSSIHPLFKKNEAYFDVAILETSPIETSERISPICLPLLEKDYDEKTAHLIGWGNKNDHGSPSKELQRVTLTVFPQRYVLSVTLGDSGYYIDFTFRIDNYN